jgi:hypothetical protein
VFNTTFSNISAISWRPVLVVEEAGVPGENHRPWASVIFQDSDLRSALLLEQAAHCYINMETPKVRKYSFHMILAGHRYSKAGQVVFTV